MEPIMTSHPADEEVAAYLSGTLSAGERAALDAHLADCRACRLQVSSARRLLQAEAGRSRQFAAGALAAAAVLAVVLLVPRDGKGPGSNAERNGGQDAAQSLQAVSPADGGTVSRDRLAFTWKSQTGDPLYRLTITTSSGEAVWTRDTNDTTLAPPDTLRLAPGATYFWYVDALDAAGLSITTGPRTLRIAR